MQTWRNAEEEADWKREAGYNAWLLQFEYVAWRRDQGLEPDRTRLNLWELAMDRIGEALESNPGK